MIGLRVVTNMVSALIKRLSLVRKIDVLLGAMIGVMLAGILLSVAASVLKHLPSTRDLYAVSPVARFFGDSTLLEKMKMLDYGRAWFENIGQ